MLGIIIINYHGLITKIVGIIVEKEVVVVVVVVV